MQLGFVLPNNWGLPDPEFIVDLAVEAEERGIHSVWVNHHVINIGYIADRLDDRPYYDALTTLTWIAARTERVRLGTSVLVMPYLHPMVLAKALATLDRLSGGRTIAGLGVGSLPEENQALDVDYESRGPWSDEFIEVLYALWGDGPAHHTGQYFEMDGLIASPKPSEGRIEAWIGGSSAPARRRAARFGRGWHPMCSSEGLARRMPMMVDALAQQDRSRADLIVAPRVDVSQVPDAAAMQRWIEAGADQLIVGTSTADESEIRSGLQHIAGLQSLVSG